jgi:hypothetical protein
MAQFKRFNTSDNPTRSDTTAAYPNGVLTWDDVNGLRLHDGETAGGNAIGGGAGGPVFQLTSSTSVAKLTSDGVLTVPGQITSVDGQSVVMFGSSGAAAILSNYIGFNQIFVQDDGAYIQTSANNMGSTFATWTFGTDGSTTFPNDTILGTGSDPNVYIQTLANGSTSTWTFGTDSQLTLPKGGIISETTSTVEIAPPSANPGQSLMIRPTASFNLSASGYIVPGENLIITLTNSNNAAVDNTYINYTITGATAQQLGLASLTGHFPYLSPAATNPQSASIVLPIPLSSAATTFTLTTDSDQPAGSANITITVTNNNIVNNEVSHVHLVAGDPSVVDLYLGDDDQYVKIEKDHGNVVIGATNFYGSPSNITSTWTFGIDGTLSLPTGNIRAESDVKIQLGVPISLGLGTGIGGWDDNGGTNLPTTGGTGSGLTVDVVGDVSGYPSSITIHTPGSGYTDGDMVTVSNGGSYYTIFVTIRTTDWQLSSTGALTFPDATVQTMAYSIQAVPSSSLGKPGDQAGMVAYSTDYFYYCTGSYNNGSSYTQYPAQTQIADANGVDTGYLIPNTYQLPSVGWIIYYNNQTAVINQVNNGGNPGYYTVFVDTVLFIPQNASLQYGPAPTTHIWQRIAKDATTW